MGLEILSDLGILLLIEVVVRDIFILLEWLMLVRFIDTASSWL
jgi:hypothetical protein